jgi:hypothetical protein
MKRSNSVKTSLATPVRQSWLQPLITGFSALIRATVGEPTWVRQRPLSFHFIGWIEAWLGLISRV